jgi:hypothetical protein
LTSTLRQIRQLLQGRGFRRRFPVEDETPVLLWSMRFTSSPDDDGIVINAMSTKSARAESATRIANSDRNFRHGLNGSSSHC